MARIMAFFHFFSFLLTKKCQEFSKSAKIFKFGIKNANLATMPTTVHHPPAGLWPGQATSPLWRRNMTKKIFFVAKFPNRHQFSPRQGWRRKISFTQLHFLPKDSSFALPKNYNEVDQNFRKWIWFLYEGKRLFLGKFWLFFRLPFSCPSSSWRWRPPTPPPAGADWGQTYPVRQ